MVEGHVAFSKVLCRLRLIISGRALGLGLSHGCPVMSGLLQVNIAHQRLHQPLHESFLKQRSEGAQSAKSLVKKIRRGSRTGSVASVC